ncbi:MAG: RdgB/HAM1 family non-canonical purine NTP pyrophosphatase [Deferribacteraceae bacterium]|jgi:XTP/dITP diphosphohydrolase|nr:RdgB/HAM1 family non-canonical purine NTP pyrophosphatase [Deferribacteraceae bacterium]
MLIYTATANKHKLEEIKTMLAHAGAEILAHPAYKTLNISETGTTFEENASKKAAALSRLTENYVIADDSGLAVDALNGAPGVYSARYAGEGADDKKNNALLLENMKDISERGATFVCVIALAHKGEIIRIFRGECAGEIAYVPKGSGGFGYDPLFITTDGRTMAELAPAEKNHISHRSAALSELANYMSNQ